MCQGEFCTGCRKAYFTIEIELIFNDLVLRTSPTPQGPRSCEAIAFTAPDAVCLPIESVPMDGAQAVSSVEMATHAGDRRPIIARFSQIAESHAQLP